MTPSALQKHGAMCGTIPFHFCPVTNRTTATVPHPSSRASSPPCVSLRQSLSEGSAGILCLPQSSHSSKGVCVSVPTISYYHFPKRQVALSKGPHRVLLGLLATCPVSTCCLPLVWMVLKGLSGRLCVGTGHGQCLCRETAVSHLSSQVAPFVRKEDTRPDVTAPSLSHDGLHGSPDKLRIAAPAVSLSDLYFAIIEGTMQLVMTRDSCCTDIHSLVERGRERKRNKLLIKV